MREKSSRVFLISFSLEGKFFSWVSSFSKRTYFIGSDGVFFFGTTLGLKRLDMMCFSFSFARTVTNQTRWLWNDLDTFSTKCPQTWIIASRSSV